MENNINAIKQAIPLIKNLHSSFWKDSRFLRWQLVRLNINYQKDVKDFWLNVWIWIKKELDIKHPGKSSILSEMEKHNFNFPPIDKIMLKKCIKIIGEREDFDFLMNNIFEKFGCYKDYPPYENETFPHWDDRYEDENMMHCQFLCDQFLNKLENNPDHSIPGHWPYPNLLSGIPTIPHNIRFPNSLVIEDIPPWRNEGKKKPGRPQDWALNLLIFELSQAGMKNKEISHLIRTSADNLLFGVVKYYDGSSDKDPFLVRINDIKKRVQEVVSQAYPAVRFSLRAEGFPAP